MLERLSIQNYAIIDELEIEFTDKLTVITGETGAGKSIIAGALGLVLGDRADSTVLVNKEKKCIVEALFRSSKKRVAAFLTGNKLDPEEELVLRREIGVNGKSRAFINDTPVNLGQLQELSLLLVDLHQQFDSQSLNESDFHREVLDALAGHSSLLEEYKNIFFLWQTVKKQLASLKEQKTQFDKEAEYNQFQFNELSEAAFNDNELEEIDAELKLMNNAEGIKSAIEKSLDVLSESETPVVQQLKVLLNQLIIFSTYHPDLPALLERMRSAQLELQDLALELGQLADQINYDPRRIEQLNERLSLGYKLQKKHGVNSTTELLDIQRRLEENFQYVLNLDETIMEKEKETSALYNEIITLSSRITTGRTKQVGPLEENVNKLLKQVGMPNARIKIEIKAKEPDLSGTDNIEFLFNANVAADGKKTMTLFQPVRKVASGGELSRLMLCIKSLVARSIDLPTMIFDEIDSGISGEAARQVGIIMKNLAIKRQVICITHQPQIAGKADSHFFVYKEIAGNNIKTNIRRLTTEERITTIAKMLSGEKPTAAALENAREMVITD